jgi:pyruvate carboxylase
MRHTSNSGAYVRERCTAGTHIPMVIKMAPTMPSAMKPSLRAQMRREHTLPAHTHGSHDASGARTR